MSGRQRAIAAVEAFLAATRVPMPSASLQDLRGVHRFLATFSRADIYASRLECFVRLLDLSATLDVKVAECGCLPINTKGRGVFLGIAPPRQQATVVVRFHKRELAGAANRIYEMLSRAAEALRPPCIDGVGIEIEWMRAGGVVTTTQDQNLWPWSDSNNGPLPQSDLLAKIAGKLSAGRLLTVVSLEADDAIHDAGSIRLIDRSLTRQVVNAHPFRASWTRVRREKLRTRSSFVFQAKASTDRLQLIAPNLVEATGQLAWQLNGRLVNPDYPSLWGTVVSFRNELGWSAGDEVSVRVTASNGALAPELLPNPVVFIDDKGPRDSAPPDTFVNVAGGSSGFFAAHHALPYSILGPEALLSLTPEVSVALLRVFIEARFPARVEDVTRVAILSDDASSLKTVIRVRVTVQVNCSHQATLVAHAAEELVNREFGQQLGAWVLVSGDYTPLSLESGELPGESHRRFGKSRGRDRAPGVKRRSRKPGSS